MQTSTKIAFLTFLVAIVTACSSPSAETLYNQGRQFRENNQPVEAMNSFIAATRVRSGEYAFKARSYSNMATMCRIGERHDLAYSLYEQSLQQFDLARDTLAQAYALNNMAWEQAVQGNKSQAALLIRSALERCSDTAVLSKVLESQAAACLYTQEYDSVLFYIQKSPVKSVYLDMLLAQAYTFLGNNDSALYYAGQVVQQTTNPRYLDDVYFILANCDSTAQADSIRTLAATRTDIQRELERNNPDWIEAMLLAEQALTEKSPLKSKVLPLLIPFILPLLGVVCAWFLWQRRRKENALKQQCRALRRSPDLRKELQWNDYTQFSDLCNTRLSGIVTKLEQRGLSEREIRFCVLVLIGLSYAQMAEVLFRAESGIGKDKYLVAKQLGVSVKDLQDTLRNIANEK